MGYKIAPRKAPKPLTNKNYRDFYKRMGKVMFPVKPHSAESISQNNSMNKKDFKN